MAWTTYKHNHARKQLCIQDTSHNDLFPIYFPGAGQQITEWQQLSHKHKYAGKQLYVHVVINFSSLSITSLKLDCKCQNSRDYWYKLFGKTAVVSVQGTSINHLLLFVHYFHEVGLQIPEWPDHIQAYLCRKTSVCTRYQSESPFPQLLIIFQKREYKRQNGQTTHKHNYAGKQLYAKDTSHNDPFPRLDYVWQNGQTINKHNYTGNSCIPSSNHLFPAVIISLE